MTVRQIHFPEAHERFVEISSHLENYDEKIGFLHWSIPEVWIRIQSGDLLLWETYDKKSIFITEIEQTFKGPIFWIVYGIGEGVVENTSSILFAFRNIAKQYNCNRLKICCRRGFDKVFRKTPFEWERPFSTWSMKVE